jgi:hypothetical protein
LGKGIARILRGADAACVLRWYFATGLVVGIALSAGSANAERTVRVRAETRIELDVSRDGPSWAVRGTLRDDGGGALGAREVHVSLRPERGSVLASRTLVTDASGAFSLEVPGADGPAIVDATFLGEADLESSSVRVVVDQRRAHVVILVRLPDGNRLSLDAPSHTVRVSASSAAGGGGLVIALLNELGDELGAGTTDATGSLELEVASSSLGPAAAGRLVARSLADDTRASAQTEVPIVRYRRTTLVWEDDATELAPDTLLRARLATSVGPLDRYAVGVFVDGQHVATRLTAADGTLTFHLDPSLTTSGPTAAVSVRFDSNAPWLEGCESAPRELVISTSTRMVPWIALASAVVFLGAAWWLRRRPALDDTTARHRRVAGVTGARATQVRATIRGVSGTVVHAATGEPIGGAKVRVGTAEATTGPLGAFDLLVPDGSASLLVEAAGFEPLQQRLVVPHRGEWRGARVGLESRRDVASRLLLEVLSVTTRGEMGSTATDRELLAIARSLGTESAELDALVAEVERIVYGEAPPSAAALEHVARLARVARSKLTRVDSASPGSL